MCVLCGEFVSEVHWSDYLVNTSGHSNVIVGDHQRDRKRRRIHQAKIANEILSHYGLKLEDWNGSKYILMDKKGQTQLVNDLGSLWPVVAQLAHRSPDPLDPKLLEKISQSGEYND
ncbi:hypothetical protein [Bacillus smithii]|uniref:hypothetical protein n=1 Tax=Bacillus smithii TaxID=1479 RepID=UPI0022E1C323|nr:hypothetical protein [Bacillus smithii]